MSGSVPAQSVAAPASTVVLLRDREPGAPEVFLVQRHGRMGFMAGMHVFPGGKVAAGDAPAAMAARVKDAQDLRAGVWGEEVDRAATFARAVAAIRETFEEAGVLLGSSGEPGQLASMRSALLAGSPLPALLEAAGLRLRLGSMQPLARWITPASEPVRFDTSFYLARAPRDQVATHDQREAVDSGWFGPGEALEAAAGGVIRLAPPTACTLEVLAGMRSSDEAIARAARQARVPRIEPVLRVEGEHVWVLLPGDPEHPVAEQALPGITRRAFPRPRRVSD